MTLTNPNLTVNYCGGTNTNCGETYKSQAELSLKRHIPLRILQLAKQRIPAEEKNKFGFMSNGKIKWIQLQPYLQTHYSELENIFRGEQQDSTEDNEYDKWELRKLKAETIAKENANRKDSDKYIDRRVTIDTFQTIIGKLFSKLSNYLEQEQPAKCDGMNAVQLKAINIEFRNRLFSECKNQLIRWESKEESTASIQVEVSSSNEPSRT